MKQREIRPLSEKKNMHRAWPCLFMREFLDKQMSSDENPYDNPGCLSTGSLFHGL